MQILKTLKHKNNPTRRTIHVPYTKLMQYNANSDTMVGIHSENVGVEERQSEDSFVCFGAKPTRRACARDFLRDQKKTRKSKVPEQNREELETAKERRRQREEVAEGGIGTCRSKGRVGQRKRTSQRSW